MKTMCRALSLLMGLSLLLLPGSIPLHAQGEEVSAEQELVDRYVPIAYLREQEEACAAPPEGGEPYLPLPVELVLDNPRVLVRDGEDDDQVVGTGPSSAELATYGPETYMDFPGDPRRPGCVFETDERLRISELGLEPTTYARIVIDDDEERLAIQYWFFWYFNDWNNTHEGDWEMIQLMWDDAGTVEDALATPPSRTGFSQHDGGELGDWGDDKIEVEDETHVRVYPAAGSHATFYGNNTYLGWGENGSGFGCDVSRGPSVRTPLQAVLVPDEIDPEGEFAWLFYEGRWGERQPSVFNGPLGPAFNPRWIDPWDKLDTWRTSSIVVPTSETLGPTMTDAFCGLTEAGSMVLIYSAVYPWAGLPLIALAVTATVLLVRRSWPTFQRAVAQYREHWRVFLGIGALSIPFGIVFNLLQAILVGYNPLRYIVTWFGDTAGARLTTVFAVGGVQQLVILLVIAPAIIQAVADIHAGRAPGVIRSYRRSVGRLPVIALTAAIVLVCVTVPLVTVVGIPLALWLLVRWHFFAQALIFDEGRTSSSALRESGRLVKGRWWLTLTSVLIFDILATIPGIVVGFGLLTIGRTAVGFANSISSLLYAVLLPLSVIAITTLFLDMRDDPIAVPGTSLQSAPDHPGTTTPVALDKA